MAGGAGKRATAWWRFYCTASGTQVVKRELSELNAEGRAALAEAMVRHRHGQLFAREHETITGSIDAIRVSIGNNQYRLLYARVGATGRVLLALTAIYKNQRKLPASDLKRAQKRLDDWNERARR